MTEKERNDLYYGIGTFAEKLSDEIARLEQELNKANADVSRLEDELDEANARIKELEEAQP
jgi:predicted  nucleic acid-binding Zn-ribbon protein